MTRLRDAALSALNGLRPASETAAPRLAGTSPTRTDIEFYLNSVAQAAMTRASAKADWAPFSFFFILLMTLSEMGCKPR